MKKTIATLLLAASLSASPAFGWSRTVQSGTSAAGVCNSNNGCTIKEAGGQIAWAFGVVIALSAGYWIGSGLVSWGIPTA